MAEGRAIITFSKSKRRFYSMVMLAALVALACGRSDDGTPAGYSQGEATDLGICLTVAKRIGADEIRMDEWAGAAEAVAIKAREGTGRLVRPSQEWADLAAKALEEGEGTQAHVDALLGFVDGILAECRRVIAEV